MTRRNLRRRDCLAALAFAALGPRAAMAAPEPSSSGLRDCMPDFWAAYDADLTRELPARAQGLVDAFFQPHAADYRRAGVDLTIRRITVWLPQFDAMAVDVRALHERFTAGYASNLARFRTALPDFDGRASPVELLPSLNYFDAHLQPDGQRLPLFFGPDGIVRIHGPGADLRVLFTHDLFHCYQAQKNPAMSLDENAPVFASLWMEGVATYASEHLNPDASLLHVLLDDARLAGTNTATLKKVALSLLTHLDATDDAAQRSFFVLSYQGDWPPRAGYYVGLLAARKLGETMTLRQMAELPTPRVRQLLEQALRTIAA